MTTSEPSPRQARQALRWVIRCSAGPLPERQQRTLQRWLQADPRHALAWRQQTAFWRGLDAAGPEVLAALLIFPSIPLGVWFSVLYYYHLNSIETTLLINISMVVVGIIFVSMLFRW